MSYIWPTMTKRILAVLTVGLLVFACNKNVTKSSDAQVASNSGSNEEMGFNEGSFNSVIVGKVARVIPPDGSLKGHVCESNVCFADVEIMAVVETGQNFHGQIEAGKTIPVWFEYTLITTDQLFPELTEPLPGLQAGDFFQARLYEHPDDSIAYRVNIYERKE